MHFFQKFGGKEYKIGLNYKTKREAKKAAKSMYLYYTRVVKDKDSGNWVVYRRLK